jgi:ABC-type sugar transport system ATPase subunit
MAVLELRHISKRYEGVPALSDVDFGAATELGAVNGIRGTTAVPP